MPLFKIDDKKVKKIIKDAVGAKEGDFAGNKMMCGTTVNPVVLVNNYSNMHYKDRTTVFTSGEIWYPLLGDDGIKRMHSIEVKQSNTETNSKDILFEWENRDDEIISDTVTITNNAATYLLINLAQSSDLFDVTTTATTLGQGHAYGKKLRLTFSSAPGTAQTFLFRMWYYD